MSNINQPSRYFPLAASAMAALWLTACGGGGGDPGPITAAPSPGAVNAGQSAALVGTAKLAAGTVPGATWTRHESARNWWAAASSADGTRLAAAVNYGAIHLSADAGTTWSHSAFDMA